VSLAGVGGYGLSRVGIHQGYAPAQPIAFSHKLHAGDNQIPCLYCHFGARTSRHGILPVNVCMNCHSMITTRRSASNASSETVQQAADRGKVHNLPILST
jgi:hypothetical protein